MKTKKERLLVMATVGVLTTIFTSAGSVASAMDELAAKTVKVSAKVSPPIGFAVPAEDLLVSTVPAEERCFRRIGEFMFHERCFQRESGHAEAEFMSGILSAVAVADAPASDAPAVVAQQQQTLLSASEAPAVHRSAVSATDASALDVSTVHSEAAPPAAATGAPITLRKIDMGDDYRYDTAYYQSSGPLPPQFRVLPLELGPDNW